MRSCGATRQRFWPHSSFARLQSRKGLNEAINLLRQLNVANSRRVPDDAPRAFVRPRWSPYIFTDHSINRRYYELCVLAELKNALRSDIWVDGSRQFRDFEDYLLSRDRFAAMRSANELRLAIDTESKSYFAERIDRLHNALTRVDALAALGQLPDAEINSGGLNVAPLTNDVPEAAEELMRQAYARLPHLKITDLLIEVDHWTGFTHHFTHLIKRRTRKRQDPASDSHSGRRHQS
jgi:Tn3 transposase DDE domain